ncbi:MAG: dual specificity protein phosphatase family protein [Ktedonobacterales bacterium]|nr:dual specificity protein phosphatase family protein [Ktedonobacterales bacterium]
MRGFYWLIEGTLAGCALPGGRGRDRGGATLEDDLAWLRGQGIGALLSLTETPLDQEALAQQRLEGLHLPVPDLAAPTPAQLARALSFIDWQRALGRATAAHCLMGQGRTGTVLAAYLIRAGAPTDLALREVRSRCPGAVGSLEQERALLAYAARRDWML